VTLSENRIAELLGRARAGDELATASLIRDMRQRIIRWALVVTRDPDDAEDVAQQVSVTIHRKLGAFDAKSSFTTWLYAVVRNAAVELTRKSYRQREVGFSEEVSTLSIPQATQDSIERMENERAAAIIRSFFTELPQRQRELIQLVDVDGYSAADAARLMGIEPETARVHLLRARRALRARMLETHPELFP